MALAVLNEPVTKFIDAKMTTVAANLTVQDAAKTMVESKTDSILVFDHGQIIGIVTEKDMLYDVLAKGLDPTKTTLRKIIKGPLITINKNATIKEAIDLMKKHDIRRLVVTDKRPIGLVTQKLVCGNISKNDYTLPELAMPDKVFCPYCSSQFKDKKMLSKHIDGIHIGKGLLEGNLKKF